MRRRPRAWYPAVRPCWPVVAGSWVVLALTEPFDLFSEYYRGQDPALAIHGHAGDAQRHRDLVGAALIALGAGWWGALAGLALGVFVAGPPTPSCATGRGVRLTIDRQVLRVGPALRRAAVADGRLGGQVIVGSDRYIIAWFKGEEAAGLYSVAVDFTFRTLTLAMMVIYTAMFPLAVRAWEQGGHDAAREQMRHNASVLLAIGLPSVAGLGLLAGSIAQCFLGHRFRSTAAGIMPLVALGSFLAGFKAYHWDAAFQFVHRTIYQVWIVLAVAVAQPGAEPAGRPALRHQRGGGRLGAGAIRLDRPRPSVSAAGSSRCRSPCGRSSRSCCDGA